ncbi:sugar ABC transporter substrate-binding protein [Acrocarpospora phusangensis]|uniref:Sugar ABC transporter substrate-binding protein n=1 Tax=Acrocarpospora phusangensis TaxID=1070424 RepID=A0A919QF16_9ACTN|nr:sugar ABC transporter substrate-binding protein [Acrocarpospora phusangensis]GIH25062.1 sugar ABC transporter substrate-binding protein [Acrocarpospora phusangensis]
MIRKPMALLALAVLTAACGGTAPETPAAKEKVTLTYSLWDPNQLPAYQECADAFTASSGIEVKITQQGWEDYWNGITTSLVSGTAPDVITNHVAYYPELAANNQLLDIEPFVARDKVDLTRYTGDLASLWVRDGKRYGLPQDWDTIALVYNVKDIEDAGIDPASLKNLTWNPSDGGTFGELIKKLTVDANGKRGDEAGFDKTKVATYGWGLEQGGGVVGQTQWSWMPLSMGFQYLDKNPFGTDYKLDDPRLAEAITWWQEQMKAGYVLPREEAGRLGLEPMMQTNKAALVPDGSWRIGTWAGSTEQKFAFAPLPAGPQGRKTIINGLAPSITAGTKHPDEAWQWVSFIGSPACQDLVAKRAVVFPAIKTAATTAAETHRAKGVDVSAFTDIAADPNSLSYYPITGSANEINTEAQAVIDQIQELKVAPADALKQLDARVADILK